VIFLQHVLLFFTCWSSNHGMASIVTEPSYPDETVKPERVVGIVLALLIMFSMVRLTRTLE
jgi:hypothetical protein